MTSYLISIPEDKKLLVLAFLKRLGVQIEPEETIDFVLSEEEKKILDEQEDLTVEECEDNDLFIAELKREYGI